MWIVVFWTQPKTAYFVLHIVDSVLGECNQECSTSSKEWKNTEIFGLRFFSPSFVVNGKEVYTKKKILIIIQFTSFVIIMIIHCFTSRGYIDKTLLTETKFVGLTHSRLNTCERDTYSLNDFWFLNWPVSSMQLHKQSTWLGLAK